MIYSSSFAVLGGIVRRSLNRRDSIWDNRRASIFQSFEYWKRNPAAQKKRFLEVLFLGWMTGGNQLGDINFVKRAVWSLYIDISLFVNRWRGTMQGNLDAKMNCIPGSRIWQSFYLARRHPTTWPSPAAYFDHQTCDCRSAMFLGLLNLHSNGKGIRLVMRIQ